MLGWRTCSPEQLHLSRGTSTPVHRSGLCKDWNKTTRIQTFMHQAEKLLHFIGSGRTLLVLWEWHLLSLHDTNTQKEWEQQFVFFKQRSADISVNTETHHSVNMGYKNMQKWSISLQTHLRVKSSLRFMILLSSLWDLSLWAIDWKQNLSERFHFHKLYQSH